MLWKKRNLKKKQAPFIAPPVQIYKFEADQMSTFQDMTYYSIFLNFFLAKVKLLFEVKLF